MPRSSPPRLGARVIASDLTPALSESGREAAAREGLELEWRQADAQALPFDDGEFEVVLSASASCSPYTVSRPPTS